MSAARVATRTSDQRQNPASSAGLPGDRVLRSPLGTDEFALRDFAIDTELAHSATGVVYRARHLRSGKTVVLKARRSAEIGREGSIAHEVELLRGLEHENIVRCFGSFWANSKYWMVLEYASGGDLSQLLSAARRQRENLSEDEVTARTPR